jgi:hypothetical protein
MTHTATGFALFGLDQFLTADLLKWLLPLVVFAGAAFLGFIVDRLVLRRLAEAAGKTDWEGDDIIIAALRGHTAFWFALGGLYGAVSL